jgi:integrase
VDYWDPITKKRSHTGRQRAYSIEERDTLLLELKTKIKATVNDPFKRELWEDGNQTVPEYFKNWYKSYSVNHQERTKATYRSTQRWLEKMFPNVPLRALTGVMFRNALMTLRDKPSFQKKITDHVRVMYRYAQEHGVVKQNPILDIKTKKRVRSEVSNNQALSETQRQDFINWLKTRPLNDLISTTRYTALALALTTGMRPSELTGITWDKVNANSHDQIIIHVTEALDSDYFTLKTTKTENRRYTLSLPLWTVSMLDTLKKQQHDFTNKVDIKNNWVFFNVKDFIDHRHNRDNYLTRPINPHNFNIELKKYQQELQLDLGLDKDNHPVKFTLYNLRHTYATNMYKHFPNEIPTIAKSLGHSTEEFLRTYVNGTQEDENNINQKIDSIF